MAELRKGSSVTRFCKDRSWQEVIRAKMMCEASIEEQARLVLMDQLLDWRWDSLARVLQKWLPLYPVLKQLLADETHYDLAVWAQHFASEATRLTPFVEGCRCHQEELSNVERIACAWKGRRLAFFACGAFDAMLRDAMCNADDFVLQHLLTRSTAAANANKVFAAVVGQKPAYVQEVPWVFCATFAGYMGQPWHRRRVKACLTKHVQTVDRVVAEYSPTLRHMPRVHRVYVASISERLAEPNVQVIYCPTKEQRSNGFAKVISPQEWPAMLEQLCLSDGVASYSSRDTIPTGRVGSPHRI